jgi:hypothetical protein
MNLLTAILTVLAIGIVGVLFTILCVIMVPVLVLHIVYTNWKEHTL